MRFLGHHGGMHPGVWIGALSGICAGLGLIVSLARTLMRAASEASVNTGKIMALLADVAALQESSAQHDTDIAVLQSQTRQPRTRRPSS